MTEARIELPPLPAKGYGNDGHSDEAMREYAGAAVLAERERAARVALDIAKWFVNGDRPDEWKLKEWAESLDRDAIAKAYEG